MPVNIKETLEEIGQLEKAQAQLELRAAQLKDDEAKLKERLKALGVTPAQLDGRIAELEAQIQVKLTLIRNLNEPVGGASVEEAGVQV